MTGSPLTIECITEAFRTEQVGKYSPDSQWSWGAILGELTEAFGSLVVDDLDGRDVINWIQKHIQWGPTTKTAALARVNRLFNWAKKSGFISKNPLTGLSKNDRPWRVDERDGFSPVSDADFERVLSFSPGWLARFLRFMRLTGCTPYEARTLNRSHIRSSGSERFIEIPKGQSEGREFKIIPVSAEIQSVLDEVDKDDRDRNRYDPMGIVFRNSRGHTLIRQSLAGAFSHVRRKAGLGMDCSLFGIGRISFYERGLKRGLRADEVAALAGLRNTTAITRRVLNKVRNDPQELAKLQSKMLHKTATIEP